MVLLSIHTVSFLYFCANPQFVQYFFLTFPSLDSLHFFCPGGWDTHQGKWTGEAGQEPGRTEFGGCTCRPSGPGEKQRTRDLKFIRILYCTFYTQELIYEVDRLRLKQSERGCDFESELTGGCGPDHFRQPEGCTA